MVTGDLREPESLRPALAGVDVVYHIAAVFREARLSDKEYHDVNVGGTRNMIEAAAQAGVPRVVHCSTIGVHGDTGKTPATEESPFNPPDYYCQTKLAGESVARELFQKYGLKGTIFRPLGLYGPGDTRFLKLFRNIKRGRFFMIGNGETLYQLSYIDDVCNGIILCGEKEEAVGEMFIIGGEGHTNLNQFVEAIARTVGGHIPRFHIPYTPVYLAGVMCESICRPLGIEPPLHRRRVEFFVKDRAADISKAKRLLGYQPQVSLADGLARTAVWYQAHGLL
jgi:nucleoside-diphosphate-sugar epimerase